MIRSRLKRLRLEKEEREGRKLPYHVISEETGLSQGVLVRLMNSRFDRVETPTLNALCRYFECGVGDLLEYVPEEPERVNSAPASTRDLEAGARPRPRGEPSEEEIEAANRRLEQTIVSLGYATGLDNEQIDADLARAYEDDHADLYLASKK
jgi:putative transcriptional regulator